MKNTKPVRISTKALVEWAIRQSKDPNSTWEPQPKRDPKLPKKYEP